MKWIKQNLFTFLAVLVFLILCGGIIFFQQRAARNSQDVADQLRKQKDRLDAIYRNKVFPSPQNVDQLQDNQKQLELKYGELLKSVQNLPPVPDMKGDKFV